jgi:thiol-disulfide isomerase/thioredoxin
MRATWIVPAVAAAAVLGFFAQRWIAAPAGDASASTAAGAPATDGLVEDEDMPQAVIPATLPTFSLADADGRQRTLQDWAGKPLMVNYWATWCGPCRREIPLLNELRAAGKPRGLEIIGVAVDFRDDVLAYASETPISYPLLIGEEDGLAAVQAMGMQPAFPFTVFADSQQRIVTVKVGELHRDEAEVILDKLAAIDAGTLPLDQAKAEIDEALKELAARRATNEAAAKASGTTARAPAGVPEPPSRG